ncbi:O-antigen ligase family protein [Algibacter sp. R77976]|uniref:O-antigen ligase family protein n=1 Tax=Algibacter sp. R77976 TaxID=3093873 RepID=UPI0037C86ADE
MKKLYLNDFVYIMFLFSFLCLGFSMAISYISNGIAVLLALFSIFSKENKQFSKKNIIYFIVVIFPFIFSVLTLIYSKNIELNLYEIEKLIFFVLTVFSLMFLEDKNKLSRNTILLYFGYITVTIYLLSIISGTVYYLETGSFFDYKYSNSFLEIQHNYLSIYGVFSCYIFLRDMARKNDKKVYALNSIFVFLIISFIVLISSRFAILLIFSLIFLFLIFSLFKKRNRKYALISLFLGAVVSSFLIFSTNTLERFQKLKVEDRSPRYSIWRCSSRIITEEVSFFKGLGAGNVQKKIDECLILNKRQYWSGLHSHNQIIGYVLAFGYLPTIILIFVFLHLLHMSLKSKDYDFLLFLIIILSFGLTENYMARRYGIFFYGFFISFFIKKNEQRLLKK